MQIPRGAWGPRTLACGRIACRASRSVVARFAHHGYEAHSDQFFSVKPVFVASDQNQFLVPAADRSHQPASYRELVDQRLGNLGWSGRQEDRVKGRFFGPAAVAIACSNRDVRVALLRQQFAALSC